MKAAVFSAKGLELREVPKPTPKAGEVLVRVRFAGLNRRDLTRAPGDEGTIPGMDWSGEVAESAGGFRAGERVMCMGAAGYAEYAVAKAAQTLPLPGPIDFEQAATLPLALMTMHDAVVTHGEVKPGAKVLVQGAGSGVGLMALQIAKLKGAALVAGSARTAASRARFREFGADLALDISDASWVKAAVEATGKGFDTVVDQVSGAIFNQTQNATAIGGRIVNVGRLGGMSADFDFNLHALRRITYVGVTFRTRSAGEVASLVRRMRDDLWPALEAGKLRLPVDRVFPLADAEAAQARMKSNAHFGKILLRMD
jgi:NADPH2:quinone reductase